MSERKTENSLQENLVIDANNLIEWNIIRRNMRYINRFTRSFRRFNNNLGLNMDIFILFLTKKTY